MTKDPTSRDELREQLAPDMENFVHDFTQGYENSKAQGFNLEYCTFDAIGRLYDAIEKLIIVHYTPKTEQQSDLQQTIVLKELDYFIHRYKLSDRQERELREIVGLLPDNTEQQAVGGEDVREQLAQQFYYAVCEVDSYGLADDWVREKTVVKLEFYAKADRALELISRHYIAKETVAEIENSHKWLQDYEGVDEIVKWVDSCVKYIDGGLFEGQKSVLRNKINTLVEREAKALGSSTPTDHSQCVSREAEIEARKDELLKAFNTVVGDPTVPIRSPFVRRFSKYLQEERYPELQRQRAALNLDSTGEALSPQGVGTEAK